MRKFAQVCGISAFALLAACGGGGGSVNPAPAPPPILTPPPGPTPPPAPTPTPPPAPTPTPPPAPTPTPAPTPPPPPPPPPPNTSLADLQSSQSFANDSAAATASFPAGGGNATTTANATTGTISYDATARSYTLSAEGRTLTFLPADIDAAQTTATLTVYKKVAGNTTDTLTLTKPGTEGRFTYTYVGGAFWQRTVQGSSAVSGTLDAFAYGIKTPAGAVPRTGRAEYGVDLIGAQTQTDSVVGMTGQGTLQVDFSTGAVVTAGTLRFSTPEAIPFSSEARLSSTGNAFSGTFRYGNFNDFSGSLNGAFYGPAAQEVGAAFSARAGDGPVAAGTIIGRGAAVTSRNTTVTSPTVNEFFANDAARLNVTITGRSSENATTGTFSNGSAAASALIVNYNAALGSYALLTPAESATFGRNQTDGQFTGSGDGIGRLTFLSNDFSRFGGIGTPPNVGLLRDLQYVRAGSYLVQQSGSGNTGYTFNQFTFGVRTPDAATPRTGTGGFVIGIRGTAADADFPNLLNFSGSGNATVNFASGALTGGGQIYFTEDASRTGRAGRTANGEFTLNAALASNRNAFSGTLGFNGIGSYSGPLAGGFYGPAAQELGGAFSASDGSGGFAVGTLVGKSDPSMNQSVPPLTNLQGNTQFTALAINLATTQNGDRRGFIAPAYLTYDAASRTYAFYHDNMASNVANIAYQFGPGQATTSDATFSRYAGTGRAGQFNADDRTTATLLNPGDANPRIALTYTSFADIGIGSTARIARRDLTIFGSATPASQMPRSGTGNYTGIVFGYGTDAGAAIDVDGTATLDVNFGAQTFASAFTIASRAPGSSVSTALGTIGYSGQISGTGMTGTVIDTAAQGSLQGQFFGPNAAEFGSVFSYIKNSLNIVGGAVGKRKP